MGDAKSPTSYVVLGKRGRHANLVLQLSGGSTCESESDAVSEFSLGDGPVASSSKVGRGVTHIIVNGKLVVDDKRRYRCTSEGCSKSYRKPSRLEEHERSHTGERPFACTVCSKTYLRENHLQAHSRSHLPDSARSFVCPHGGCEKKFWTAQHLKRHAEMHADGKPFKCTEDGCLHTFAKHNQLRSHIAASHCPPGTKPYRCEHSDCTKSFSTSQKLGVHSRTHEERRYVCAHPSCSEKEEHTFFPTWSALQEHNRAAHPATCPYQSCNGKTFSQQKGLRAHLKLHEQQEVESALEMAHEQDGAEDADDENDGRPTKRRRGGEIGRDWKCERDGCGKDFKSKKALTTHVNVFHLQRRDFVCTVDGCGVSFGYKHLLQRHTSRLHTVEPRPDHVNINEREENPVTQARPVTAEPEAPSVIDVLTGKAYDDRAKERLMSQNVFVCPFPNLPFASTKEGPPQSRPSQNSTAHCTYVFSRAYDFRRHLSSVHGVKVDRQQADELVATFRRGKAPRSTAS
ncbi:hypothetical protein M0805_003957 [Coniferiporia weirii]|nr:hypothetical protein M0805_003957 [Coniferiporia weirii]